MRTFEVVPRSSPERFRWLLVLQFWVINIALMAAVGVAYMAGWLDHMIETDATYNLVKINCVIFLIGWVLSVERAHKLSRELNVLAGARDESSVVYQKLSEIYHDKDRDSRSRGHLYDALKIKMAARLGWITRIVQVVVTVGLIGTGIALIMSLLAIDEGSVGNASAIQPMIAKMLNSTAIAFYKTVVGLILSSCWLAINLQLLRNATAHIISRVIEIGESVKPKGS